MIKGSSLVLAVFFVGITFGQLASAQPRQRRLTAGPPSVRRQLQQSRRLPSTGSPSVRRQLQQSRRLPSTGSPSVRRQLQQSRRLPSTGPLLRTRGSLLPGPRHTLNDRRRAPLQQRHSGLRSRVVDPRPIPTGSNRLRSVSYQRRARRPIPTLVKALHRQPGPTRTSRIEPKQPKAVSTSPTHAPGPLRIFARNLKVIDGARTGRQPTRDPKSMRQPNAPRPRSPLRIRARLGRISKQEARPVQVQVKERKPLKTKSGSGSSKPNIKGGHRDMIAVDDIIALVKAIRGSKEPVPTKTPVKSVTTASKPQQSTGKRVDSSKTGGKKIGSSTSVGGNHNGQSKAFAAAGGGKAQNNPATDLLTQFALMNNNEGALSSLFSDPLLLQQLMSSGSGSMTSEAVNFEKAGQRGGGNGRKTNVSLGPKSSVVIHPSLLQGNRKSDRRLVNTGNPVQDKMISSLMEQTMKNIREEIQENLRKRQGEAETPASRMADNQADNPVLVL